jgi:hypothetical protein
LLCRLLCAANSAYGIQPNQPFAPELPYYDRVGYVDEPTAIQGGLGDIDAVLVGLAADGIVVAFRGTLPPVPPITVPIVLDWLQDFLAIPEHRPGFPGKVHLGFYRAIENLGSGLLNAVTALRAKHSGAPIQVTGHSKGGALVSLGAWLLSSHGFAPEHVVSFASPHVGDADFANAYNALLSQVRYENYLDLAPFVPPDLEHRWLLGRIPDLGRMMADAGGWDYQPVGTLRYIKEDGSVIDDYPGLESLRIAEIAIDIAIGKLDAVVHAHSLVGAGLVYCRGVCDSKLCAGGTGQT